MLVAWQNGRIAVGSAMAWQFLCCNCCCCYGGCCCLLLLGIMCWWDGRMAEWVWAVPWPMPLKPHTERRQEFGQGRTTYPSQAAPNIGGGNIPNSKDMFAVQTLHTQIQRSHWVTSCSLVWVGADCREFCVLHMSLVICLLYLYFVCVFWSAWPRSQMRSTRAWSGFPHRSRIFPLLYLYCARPRIVI